MKPNYLEYWYDALNAPIGVKLEEQTNRLTSLIQALYKARIGIPELQELSIVRDPFNKNCIWIIKRNVELPDEENASDAVSPGGGHGEPPLDIS